MEVCVEDDDGAKTCGTLEVMVLNLPPTVTVLDIVGPTSPLLVLPGQDLEFIGAFTDAGILDTHVIEWDFGDGSSVSGTLTPTHSYATTGDFVVILTVTDNDGGVGTDTQSPHVADLSEAADLVIAFINGLPDSAFARNPDVNKATLARLIGQAQAAADRGNNRAAGNLWERAIRRTMDGSVGGRANDDWITDPAVQDLLNRVIDAILAQLT